MSEPVNPLRYAIVGAGRPSIATTHHLPAIAGLSDYAIRLLADINPDVQQYAERYGVEWTTDFSAVLQRPDIDVVDICTPDYCHAEQAIAALKAGKHVISQKPMALTVRDAREMLHTARACGRKLQIVTALRCKPKWTAVKQAVASGRIGTPRYMKYSHHGRYYSYEAGSFYRRQESGGQMIRNGMHYIDFIAWVMNAEPIGVRGCSRAHYAAGDRMETDNYILSNIDFDNGSLATCEVNMTLSVPKHYPGRERILVVGDKGHVQYDSLPDTVWSESAEGHRGYPLAQHALQADPEAFRTLFANFADHLLRGVEQEVPPERALRVFETCVGALVSSQRNEQVPLPLPDGWEFQ